jgi:pimeloyl-ACP methyl ester carboxylesterase
LTAQFKTAAWRTRSGDVAGYVAQAATDLQRPVVVFLHGAGRSSASLVPWGDLLGDVADVVLLDLPGHGKSTPISPSTVSAMGDALHDALQAALPDRQLLLVGESLGGTIALAIGGQADPHWIRAVFAADPPLTTAKLWSVTNSFRRFVAGNPDHPFGRVSRDAFGITPDDVEELIYYPLVGALRMPALIATGDIRLLPPRQVNGVTCLFDAVDQFVVDQLYPDKARIHRIAGCGHLLLDDARAECLRLIHGLLAEHMTTTSARADPTVSST